VANQTEGNAHRCISVVSNGAACWHKRSALPCSSFDEVLSYQHILTGPAGGGVSLNGLITVSQPLRPRAAVGRSVVGTQDVCHVKRWETANTSGLSW